MTDTVLLAVYTEVIKGEVKMDELKNDKIERVLGIYTKLMNGCLKNKAEEAINYGVNEQSIQRDIDDIRNFLELDSEILGS